MPESKQNTKARVLVTRDKVRENIVCLKLNDSSDVRVEGMEGATNSEYACERAIYLDEHNEEEKMITQHEAEQSATYNSKLFRKAQTFINSVIGQKNPLDNVKETLKKAQNASDTIYDFIISASEWRYIINNQLVNDNDSDNKNKTYWKNKSSEVSLDIDTIKRQTERVIKLLRAMNPAYSDDEFVTSQAIVGQLEEIKKMSPEKAANSYYILKEIAENKTEHFSTNRRKTGEIVGKIIIGIICLLLIISFVIYIITNRWGVHPKMAMRIPTGGSSLSISPKSK